MNQDGKRPSGLLALAVIILLALAGIAVFAYRSLAEEPDQPSVLQDMAEKPVIYLYPERETRVHVGLDLDGTLTASYPVYPEGGWDVTAHPDGTLDHGGKSYRYLYWEGVGDWEPDFSSGFLITPETVLDFLEEKLTEIGLNEYEKQEMIVYWLPELLSYKYSLVSFQFDNYTDWARLDIIPEPDSVLRVCMAIKYIDRPIDIPQQEIVPFVRDGFVVVEWGGIVAD